MRIEPFQPRTIVFIRVTVKDKLVEVPAVVWQILDTSRRRVYCQTYRQYFDLPITALRELTIEERKARRVDDDD
jgi:hypothetical protein